MNRFSQSTISKAKYYREVIKRDQFCGLKGIFWGTALSLPLWGALLSLFKWLL
ncbi:MAG: hypothetical protein ACRBF0_18455 [Calditrichia bacterium]